jgi:succinoglycan biosynthesis protein ExoA
MDHPTPKPLVTIAIVSSEDEARIESCLRCALTQDYPRDRLEVVVADAMSMDATREIVLRVAGGDDRVRLLDNPDRTRAAGLNEILRGSRGEIVVPMEPTGEYGSTHVSKCVEALSSSPAEHLAIVPRTAGRTLVERALSAVEKTRLAFGAGAELSASSDPVPSLLGAVKRRVFERVGLFDPESRCEEEVELARRIADSGGAVTVRRDIVVHRTEAASFKELFRNHYRLGKSRARRTMKDRRIRDVRTLAPLAMVAVGGALAATSSIQPITPLALAGYALMTGAAAVRVGGQEGMVTIPIAWAAYPVMHLAHGVGFGAGLVRAIAKPSLGAIPRLDPEPVGPA